MKTENYGKKRGKCSVRMELSKRNGNENGETKGMPKVSKREEVKKGVTHTRRALLLEIKGF